LATTGVALLTLVGGPTWVAVGLVVVFIGLEALAAAYLAVEARRRKGASRVRMVLAALATGAFAVAFVTSGNNSPVNSIIPVGQLLSLFAAAGYVVAFLPPAWLRRLWQANSALSF